MTQRGDAVRIALGEKGKPYETHRDCSGFTAWVARQVSVTIPEGSVAQFSAGTRSPNHDDEPGLLHFWDTYGEAPGHVALGIGGGQIIHALNEQRGIVISDLHTPYMGGNNRYMGARRIFTYWDSPIVEEPAPVEESWGVWREEASFPDGYPQVEITPTPKHQGPNRHQRRAQRKQARKDRA